jgi:hypothetical protein
VPTVLKFLCQIFDGNENIIRYLQRFVGYCLTGRTDEQILLFFYGLGCIVDLMAATMEAESYVDMLQSQIDGVTAANRKLAGIAASVTTAGMHYGRA